VEGACVNSFVFLDTKFTRRFMESTCTGGPPCHVFLTIPLDPSSEMIVNHHTTSKEDIHETIVRYDVVSHASGSPEDYAFSVAGRSFRMPDLEVNRDVHWTHLTDLQPNTTYYFIAGPGYSLSGELLWTGERKFRTFPADSSSYSFVAGGDMDETQFTISLSSVASKTYPLFAVVGGDLAYERAQPTCYRRVDIWIQNWMNKMISPDGYTIPLLTAIGNHEVYADYGSKASEVPFYIRYFPHMSAQSDPGSSIEQVDSRPTYHAHVLNADSVLFCLDSGHVASPKGKQAEWLSSQFEIYHDYQYKFATYHVPMYPTVREYTYAPSEEIRHAWLPIFDENNLTVAFENHDHAYKRTKLLRGGKEQPGGTLFVGDGCWGVGHRALPADSPRWYHEVARTEEFILHANVNEDNLKFEAYGDTGIVFDRFNLSVPIG